MNVVTLKLVNGDEIIGREVGSSTNKIEFFLTIPIKSNTPIIE